MTRDGRVIDRRTALVTGVGAIGAIAGLGAAAPAAFAAEPFSQSDARAAAVDWKAVQAALGKQGQMEEGGVFHVEVGREKPVVRQHGMQILPAFGLAAEVMMMPMGSGMVMAMGEIPCLESEVNDTITRLLNNGIMVSAIHNHRIALTPVIMWVHYSGQGNAVALARGIRAALPAQGADFSSGAPAPQQTPLPVQQMQTILGGKATIQDGGVVEVTVQRQNQIRVSGMVVPAAMGVEADIYFQPTGPGRAAMTVELSLEMQEVNAVLRSLRSDGVQVSALHNHMLDDQPHLFFMHGSATGTPLMLASMARRAMDHANFERGHGGAGKG